MAGRGGRVRYYIEADSRSAERANARVGKSLDKLDKTGARVGRGFAQHAKKIAAFGAGFASFSAIKGAVSDTVALGKATAGLQRITGLDAKTASAWVEIAKVRGVQSKQLNIGFITLARSIRAANAGSEKQTDLFRRLGVEQRVLESGKTAVVMNELADAFERLPNGAQKAAIAQQLFGRQAQTILPLLNKGSEGLREQIGLAERYGATLDKAGVKKALEAAQAQRELNLALDGVKLQLGQALLPALTKGAQGFAHFASQVRRIMARDDLTGEQKFDRIGDIIAGKIEKATPKIANAAGRIAPRVALAFVRGFINADGWGHLVAGAWILSKARAWPTIFNRQGGRSGSAFGRGFASKALIAVAAGIAGWDIGTLIGNKIRGETIDLGPLGKIKLGSDLAPGQTKSGGSSPLPKTPIQKNPDRKRDPIGGGGHRRRNVVHGSSVGGGGLRPVTRRSGGARASAGGRLSYGQIVTLAQRTGFPNPQLAAAVAMAESGGNIGAHGDRTLGGSYGLWQIHHPSHPGYDIDRLASDATYNARAAYNISGGGRNWSPWTTYRTGAYKQFLKGGGGAPLPAGIGGGAAGGGAAAAPRGPSREERLDSQLAIAELSPSLSDDLRVLRRQESFFKRTLTRTRKSGNVVRAGEAARGLKTTRDAIKDIQQRRKERDPFNITGDTRIDRARAMIEEYRAKGQDQYAEETENYLAGLLEGRAAARSKQGKAAEASQLRAEAFELRKGPEAAAPDTSAADAAADLERQRLETLQELARLQGERLALSNRLASTEFGVLKQAIADVVSGQIGGRVGLAHQTPAFAGGGVRY